MNKIIVSIILTLVLILGINKITDTLYYVEKPEKSAYQVDGTTEVSSISSTESNTGTVEPGNIMAVFASTSADEGKAIFKNVPLVIV